MGICYQMLFPFTQSMRFLLIAPFAKCHFSYTLDLFSRFRLHSAYQQFFFKKKMLLVDLFFFLPFTYSELCLQLMLVTANMMQGVGAGELRWHLQS